MVGGFAKSSSMMLRVDKSAGEQECEAGPEIISSSSASSPAAVAAVQNAETGT